MVSRYLFFRVNPKVALVVFVALSVRVALLVRVAHCFRAAHFVRVALFCVKNNAKLGSKRNDENCK